LRQLSQNRREESLPPGERGALGGVVTAEFIQIAIIPCFFCPTVAFGRRIIGTKDERVELLRNTRRLHHHWGFKMKYSTPIDKQIGARLRSRRVELGLPIEQFALALDAPISQVEQWELGLMRMGAEKLLASSKLLDVGPDFFFSVDRSGKLQGGIPDRPRLGQTVVAPPPEAETLLQAFASIKSPAVRRMVLDLLEGMAQRENHPDPLH
jgi:transcriptional regulator with XRE-family HTH domain